MWFFLPPEYFIIVDFFLNLFDKSGENPNGSEGLKDGFEEKIFNKERQIKRPHCFIRKSDGPFLFWYPAREWRLNKKMKIEDSKGQVVLYKNRLEVRLVKDTVWLSLNQMADLFERDKFVISRHLHNVFKHSELTRNSVVAKFATTAPDWKTIRWEYFNLDVELLETAERKADTEPIEVPAGGEAKEWM
jgi:hypothetical protein